MSPGAPARQNIPFPSVFPNYFFNLLEKIKKDESNVFLEIIHDEILKMPPNLNISRRANNIVTLLMEVFPEYSALERPEVTEANRKKEERERALARRRREATEKREKIKAEKQAKRRQNSWF